MMARINIHLEVDDEVYDTIIAPAKANRRLNDFIRRLLDAYSTNEYVHAIVDGDEMASNEFDSLLQEAIGQAEGVSASTASLGAATEAGKRAFEEGVFSADSVGVGEGGSDDGKLDAITERLDSLTSLVEALVAGGFTAGAGAGAGGGVRPEPVAEPVSEPVEESPEPVDEPLPVSTPEVDITGLDLDDVDSFDDEDDDFDDYSSGSSTDYEFMEAEEESPEDAMEAKTSKLFGFVQGGL